MKKLIALSGILFFFIQISFAQEEGYVAEKEYRHSQEFWLGTYTKYRISEKIFYYGEYHLRRRNHFVEDMGQVYLRFGLTYLINNYVEVTGGVVTPFYWAPKQDQLNQDNVVPQYRFWQQLLLVQPMGRLKLYHQFRFEQRWKRDYQEEAPFKFSSRFRYKISAYYPLNNERLLPKTLFLSLYEEIFIQAGKDITYNYLEDNRVFAGLGYIINENFQVQAGYQMTFRYDGGPTNFEIRHIPRLSLYHNVDFYNRKIERQREKIRVLQDEF